MSEIKVNSIKGVGATNAAITVNNSDGTCTANLTNRINKNIVQNGAMLVAQKGVGPAQVDGIGSVDRFKLQQNSVSNHPTQSQVDVASGTTPYSLGFRKALKLINGSNTVGTDDILVMKQVIEAQNMASSGWNYTSDLSFITLQFWIKSSVPQNFYFYLRTYDGTAQIFPMETGSLTADTWTKITKTIPGNSNLQFDNNANEGVEVTLNPYLGTDRTDPSVSLNSWAAYGSGTTRTPTQTSTWYTTNNATLEFTGFQLEVGSVATDFEHRSFGQELALCQRYYQQSYEHGTSAGTNTNTNSIVWYPDATNNYASVSFGLPVVMRTQPTVTIYSSTGASGKIRNADAATDHNSYVNTNNNSFLMFAVNNSQISQTNTVRCHYTASAEL